MSEPIDELVLVDAGGWRRWLDEHHATAQAAWLVVTKKGRHAPTTITFDEALTEACCYGWIDNKTLGRDDVSYRIRFTPRRAGGAWSPANIRLATSLIEAGRMRPSGLAEVERARADGRWPSG